MSKIGDKNKERIGRTYNNWTVLEYIGKRKSKRLTYYLCRCWCGQISPVAMPNLLYGHTTGCHICASKRKAKREDIIRLFNEGKTQAEVARILGISRERVRQVVRLVLGIDTHKGKEELFKAAVPTIVALYKQGFTVKGIAKELGWPLNKLWYRLRKDKIKLERGNVLCKVDGCHSSAYNLKRLLCRKHHSHYRYLLRKLPLFVEEK